LNFGLGFQFAYLLFVINTSYYVELEIVHCCTSWKMILGGHGKENKQSMGTLTPRSSWQSVLITGAICCKSLMAVVAQVKHFIDARNESVVHTVVSGINFFD